MEEPKSTMESQTSMNREEAKKLKVAFDREYRKHGVEPPAAPTGWWRYDLGNVDGAGWPDGWMEEWRPDVTCAICSKSVEGAIQLVLMGGEYGIERYPVHTECGEEPAKHMSAQGGELGSD